MDADKDNDYTICFKNVIFVMKMFAVYPFFSLHEVFNISHLLSMILTIISVSLFAWINFIEQRHLYGQYRLMLQNFGLFPLLTFLPHVSLKVLLLTGPCLMWNKNKHLRNYRNTWKRFQLEMEKLTGRSFNSSLKNKIQAMYAISIISFGGIAVLIKTRKWRTTPSTSLLSMLYMIYGTANMTSFWVLNNFYTISSTKQVIRVVQQSINKNRDEDLRRLMNSWMMLCDLTEQFVDSHSNLFLLLFCMATLGGVVCFFCAVLIIIYWPDKSIGLTYFSITAFSILNVIAFCESANSVTKYMVHKLREILLKENVKNKNRKILQMIILFLQTTETKNPQVTFNGYMTVDRSIIISVMGTALYFLVVLKQFSPD